MVFSVISNPQEESQVSSKAPKYSLTGVGIIAPKYVAFNNYGWTFYEGELGLIGIIASWPLYMAFASVFFNILSILINPLVGYVTNKPMKWTKK